MKSAIVPSMVLASCAALGADSAPLRVGEVVHGFRVREVRELPDVASRMWRMEHVVNGADLVWIESGDLNKTFAVAFKTLPDDDTGVAHIVEHSVLCGSERFPVKEPFVELLKGSLATYINASTASDVTVYPVCSRNDRDLLNLAEVYLDAVFAPLSAKNDWAMPQERNVVLNEMKGAMSAPGAIAYRELSRMLFPASPYGFNSGGDPAAIPTLGMEKYRAFIDRFYHPSNARIFLFGKVDVVPMLRLVDSYVGRFPRREPAADPPAQPPVASEREVEYPCDSVRDRVRLCQGWAFGSWRDDEKSAAMDVVCDLLAGSNDAPLKKAMLEAGLCEDVEMWCQDGAQNKVELTLVNVRDGRLDEARRALGETLARVVREGFDRERISAKLDQAEFRLRERDTSQLGLGFLWTSLGSWLHGGDPAARIEFSRRIASLRRLNGTGYYERLLREAVLDNPHHATLVMKPTVAPRPAAGAETATPSAKPPADSPEALARLPRLHVADIPEECGFPTWETSRCDGVEVVRPNVASNGISYATLAFSVGDLADEEKSDLPLLADALGHVATGKRGVEGLRREIESRLGNFDADVTPLVDDTYFMVEASFLESHADDALGLLSEVLTGSDFSSEREISDLRAQEAIDFEHSLLSGGHSAAAARASRGLSAQGRDTDLVEGLSQFERIRGGSRVDLGALASKVFVRGRMRVALANSPRSGFERELVSLFPAGAPAGARRGVSAADAGLPRSFPTKGRGAFTAMCARLPDGVAYSGAFKVASRILSLDFLWNEIRVKGGAYGGTLLVTRFGDLQFMSWRDPRPADTFAVYARCAGALREFVRSGASFEPYQVSAVGKTEPNLTVRGEVRQAFLSHLGGVTNDDRRRERREMLRMTSADLLRFADALDAALPRASRCAVGEEALVGCAGEPGK